MKKRDPREMNPLEVIAFKLWLLDQPVQGLWHIQRGTAVNLHRLLGAPVWGMRNANMIASESVFPGAGVYVKSEHVTLQALAETLESIGVDEDGVVQIGFEDSDYGIEARYLGTGITLRSGRSKEPWRVFLALTDGEGNTHWV